MNKKVFAIISSIILAATLSGCGYDGHYRYPCQDPENWTNAECQPPVCEASGTCLTDLLGFDPLSTESDTIEVEVVEETSEETEEIEE